jgi:hypothetical protein
VLDIDCRHQTIDMARERIKYSRGEYENKNNEIDFM